jgi:hypothetical protein
MPGHEHEASAMLAAYLERAVVRPSAGEITD